MKSIFKSWFLDKNLVLNNSKNDEKNSLTKIFGMRRPSKIRFNCCLVADGDTGPQLK
jgi:hypothetical protein